MTEHHGRTDEHGHHEGDARSTSEAEGSYVDSEVPETATTDHPGRHDVESDGEYTDSDVPSDR